VSGLLYAGTYYVAPSGNDDGLGSAELPFRTISRAASVARNGDVVVVREGRYVEQVAVLHSGVTFRAAEGEAVVVDGDNRLPYGFYNGDPPVAVDNVVIEGFEIRRQTRKGIYIQAGGSDNWVIRNNRVHHIPLRGIEVRGRNHIVARNEIFMIGNEQEAMGIKLHHASECLVEGNQIYLIKKEGIRDVFGTRNVMKDNIIYASWAGIAFNAETSGSAAYNNYIYGCVYGFYPKHLQGDRGWNRFWHNTVYGSLGMSVNIAVNLPALDYLDIRNNIFCLAGESHIFERTSITGPHLVIDGNLYYGEPGRPRFIYKPGEFEDLSELRAGTPYEDHGLAFNPRLIDPEHGNLDYPADSLAAAGGLDLPSPYGRQLGAKGLVQTTPDFEPLPLTAVGASRNERRAKYTVDGNSWTTWDSAGANRDQWISYEVGGRQSFRFIILVPFGHKAQHNVQHFSFDISEDGLSWRRLLSGKNNNSGNIFIYDLGEEVQARYLRFNMYDNFPEDGKSWTEDELCFAELIVGNLIPKNSAPRPTLTFVAQPSVIRPGETVVLSWGAEGATYCRGEEGLTGTFPAWGIREVKPERTTTYLLTAVGPGGEVTERVTVTVLQPTPSVRALYSTKVVDGSSVDWGGIPLVPLGQYNVAMPDSSPEPSDVSAHFGVAWDENFLYVLAVVTDDEYDVTGGPEIYHNDGIEILIDGLNDRASTMGRDDHQIFIQADGVVEVADSDVDPSGIEAVGHRDSEGYVLEVGIPWSYVRGAPPEEGRTYGFTLVVNDRDGEARQSQLFWVYTPRHWASTTGYGNLILGGDQPVAVAGATRTVNLPVVEAAQGGRVIDAREGDWKAGSWESIQEFHPDFSQPSPTRADLSGRFAVCWDQTYLYVLVQVTDDKYEIADSEKIYHDDGIEILIDGLNDGGDFGSDDHQIFVRADGVVEAKAAREGDIIAAAARTQDGYIVEAAIRWSFIGGRQAEEGVLYGFDVVINDRDNGKRETQAFWRFARSHWRRSPGWGRILLGPEPAEVEAPAPVQVRIRW